MPRMLTVGEVAALCARLTGQPCSIRQVRHLLVGCRLGSDRERRRHGQTRLHGVDDVAMVRLALLLHADGVSPWVARVVLTFLRNDIVLAWKAGASLTLVVVGIQGALQPSLRSRPAGAMAAVALRDVWRGLDAEVQAVCQTRNTVWMWREVAVQAVPRSGG